MSQRYYHMFFLLVSGLKIDIPVYLIICFVCLIFYRISVSLFIQTYFWKDELFIKSV